MKTNKLLVMAMALLVAGCGGGGAGPQGQGEPPPIEPPPVTPPVEPPAATFNMDAAYAAALSSGVSSDWMPATASGSAQRLAMSFEPTTDGPLLGQTFKRSRARSSLLASAGTLVPTIVAASTISFTVSPTVIAGQVDADGHLTRYIGLGNLPTAATVGASGPYARAIVYAGASEENPLREQLVSWSIEADTAATAWACLTFTASDGAIAEKDCLRIDSAGTVSAVRTQQAVSGASRAFQGDHLAAPQPLPATILDGDRTQIQATAATVISDRSSWDSFWYRHTGTGPALPVDFSAQMVAAMTLGGRPSSCWGVSLVGVDEWPDRIAVRYREALSTQACAQAVVYPALLVALPGSRKPVEWVAAAGSQAANGDHGLSPQVSAWYDATSTGTACRLLHFQASFPASEQAAAADISEPGLLLIDSTGRNHASSWQDVQVSVAAGQYRIVGAGCPPAPEPHGVLLPVLTAKVAGIGHKSFGAAIRPLDPSALALGILNSSVAAVASPQFFTTTTQAEFAVFWNERVRYSPVPTVDFSRRMVGAILLPATNDCNRVEVDAAVQWPDRIEVQYALRGIPGLACAAVVIASGAQVVFTMPTSTLPFEWVMVSP